MSSRLRRVGRLGPSQDLIPPALIRSLIAASPPLVDQRKPSDVNQIVKRREDLSKTDIPVWFIPVLLNIA